MTILIVEIAKSRVTSKWQTTPSTTLPLDDALPCLPGLQPLWPGGPALPRWVELEAAREGVPEEPPTDAQARYLRALGAEVPISKGEAGALLTRLTRARKRRSA